MEPETGLLHAAQQRHIRARPDNVVSKAKRVAGIPWQKKFSPRHSARL
jgi:hypothetical protein